MLRERPIEIEPRKSTPTAVGGFKKILRPELIEPGRALSLLNDAAWGRLVVQGKFKDEHFSDELVEAAAALIKNWGPTPAPEWVTAVPSLRHPELVPDFARRLAEAIGLPYSQAVGVAKQVQEQSKLENSRQQYLNVQGAFGVDREACLPGPVLLIDDTVDSKWTLTEVGRQLRQERGGGCGAVCVGERGGRGLTFGLRTEGRWFESSRAHSQDQARIAWTCGVCGHIREHAPRPAKPADTANRMDMRGRTIARTITCASIGPGLPATSNLLPVGLGSRQAIPRKVVTSWW